MEMGSKGRVDVSLQCRICHLRFYPAEIFSEVCDPRGDLSAADWGNQPNWRHLRRLSIPLSPSGGFGSSPEEAGGAS